MFRGCLGINFGLSTLLKLAGRSTGKTWDSGNEMWNQRSGEVRTTMTILCPGHGITPARHLPQFWMLSNGEDLHLCGLVENVPCFLLVRYLPLLLFWCRLCICNDISIQYAHMNWIFKRFKQKIMRPASSSVRPLLKAPRIATELRTKTEISKLHGKIHYSPYCKSLDETLRYK